MRTLNTHGFLVARLSKRKMANLIPAILGAETRYGQKQLVYCLAFWHLITDKKDAWHRFAGANPIICESGNRVAIMGEQDSGFVGSPRQDGGVGSLGHPSVLNAHQLEVGRAAKQAADDIAVEVFVSEQLHHGAALSHGPAPEVRLCQRGLSCRRLPTSGIPRQPPDRTAAGIRRLEPG